jgi:MFS family permease
MALGDRRLRVLAALGVALIVGSLGMWAQNSALVGVNYDDAIYALLARALLDGHGYRLAHLGDLPGIKYPPIYPLSLTPFWLFADSQESALHVMKLANGVFIGLAAGLFAFLLAELRILSLPLAAGAALLGFASGSMMLVTSGLLSEPLYLFLLFLTLWRADVIRERRTIFSLFAIGLLASMTALTRMAGVTLVAAVLLGLKSRYGRRGPIAAGIACALLLVPWLGFTLLGSRQVPDFLVPRYGSYSQLYLSSIGSSPGKALEVLLINMGAILQTLGSLVIPQAGAGIQSLIGAIVIGLAALGSKRVFGAAPTLALYPWFYLLLVSVWTFPPFRFVFVVFPLLLALAAVSVAFGFEWLSRSAADEEAEAEESALERRRWQRWAAVGLVVLVVANMSFRQSRALYRRVWDGAQLQKSAVGAEVIDWVDSNLPPRSVIAFEFDPMLSLHSGRAAVPNNYEPIHPWFRSSEPDVDTLARLLREMRVDYLAVRRDAPAAVEPIDRLMDKYPGSLELVHITPGGVLILETKLSAMSRAMP